MFHTLETERNRGICLYAHRDLKPSVCEHLNCDFLESVFVDCKTSDGLSLVVGLVYRSPGSTQENNDKLLSLLSKATEQQRSNLIIMGDFNFPTINWRQGESGDGLDHPATKFLNATKDAFLIQHQTVPTRHREREKYLPDTGKETTSTEVQHSPSGVLKCRRPSTNGWTEAP